MIGNGGGNYRLEINCIDETLAAPNASMSPGVLNQQFLAADGWQAGGAAGNFLKEQVFNINVDNERPRPRAPLRRHHGEQRPRTSSPSSRATGSSWSSPQADPEPDPSTGSARASRGRSPCCPEGP